MATGSVSNKCPVVIPEETGKIASDKKPGTVPRSRKMAAMERDLASQAESFLDKLLEDKISESEKLALEEWLSSQLEAERQGWKKKLQMSMKEIERERKMALEVHGAIHRMNSQLENVGGFFQLYREPSMYQGSDKDLKTSHIEQLQKNIDAATNMTRRFQEEKLECFAVLKIDNFDQNLARVVKEYLGNLQEEISKLQKEVKDIENTYLADIEKLHEDLESERCVIRDLRDDHAEEVRHLKASIEELKLRTPETSKPSSRADSACVCTCADKIVQVDIRVATRECCIQTDISKESLPKVEVVEPEMPAPVTEIRITKSQSRGRNIMQLSNIGCEDLERQSSLQGLKTPTQNGDIKSIHKQMEQRVSRYSEEFDSRNTDQRQTIDHLRTQVVNFAQKLELTKQQVDIYQRQLATIKTGSLSKPTKNAGVRPQQVTDSGEQSDNLRRWASEGFLGGTKKEMYDKDADVMIIHSKFKKLQLNKSQPGSNMATAKCLRCQKLYRLRDNHQGACLFHLKTRRKVERYDTAGRLLRISMVWDCCKEGTDSLGCAVGQHV